MNLGGAAYLTDENIHADVVAFLRGEGCDVLDVKESGLTGLDDLPLIQRAFTEQRVLRNRLGIRRKRAMDVAEYQALLRVQEAYLQRISGETRFTAALLREMHRNWLGEIYAWAGYYRTVELSKGGFRRPPAHLLSDNMARFEAGLPREHTPCRPALLPEVARRIAEVHAELLLIHPFREGNGRLARWLAALMAMQAGYAPPRFVFRGRGGRKNQTRYLEAVKRGYPQDYEALAGFFREAIERRLPGSI